VIDITWQTAATGIVSPEGPAVDLEGNIFLVSRWTGKVLQVNGRGDVSELVDTGGKPQSIALLPNNDLLLADAKNQACSESLGKASYPPLPRRLMAIHPKNSWDPTTW